MEEFCSVIADSVASAWSTTAPRHTRLLDLERRLPTQSRGPKKFFEAYEHRKATVVTHPTYGCRMSYGRTLGVPARMLAAYVRGDIPRYSGFTARHRSAQPHLRRIRPIHGEPSLRIRISSRTTSRTPSGSSRSPACVDLGSV